MTVTEIQQKIIELQDNLLELQKQLTNAELNPNADEAAAAYLDLGEKAIGFVQQFLNGFQTFLKKIG